MMYQYTFGLIEIALEKVFIILIGMSNSYLLSLILLAIFVRFATRPLEKYANRAVNSQAEIESVLSPQIDETKSKHTGIQRHNAIKRLYARYAYHPLFAIRSLAGIGIQLPFFIAAYFMLSGYLELNGIVIPILGDLGKPDTLLFGDLHLMPFVMTLVNVLALISVPNFNRKSLIQGLFISLMFLVLLYESPLSLLIYWTTSNLFSLISNFTPSISEKIKLKKSKSEFKNTFIGRIFEGYFYLFFITNLAILIPLLGVLGEQFNFFTSHSLSSTFIIRLLLVISLAPALILAVLRWASKRIGFVNVFDKLILFVFLGLFVFYSLNKVGYGLFPSTYEPYILFALTLIVTIIAVILIFKKQILRNLSYLSLIIPLIFLNFIFVSPASSLFKHSDTDKDLFPEIAKINDTPVFLLIFDEFSGLTLQNLNGQLDKPRYPGFAELASKADYFPNALTASSSTSVSIPSIASGNLPIRGKHGLTPDDNLISFFQSNSSIFAQSTVLSADLMSKQSTDKISFISDLLTLYIHILSHQDWIEDKIGAIPQAWKDFGIFFKNDKHQQVKRIVNPHVKQFLEWQEQINNSGVINQFNFIHTQFPHVPHNTTALGRLNKNGPLLLSKFQIPHYEHLNANQSSLNVAYHSYMQQTAYTDHLIMSFINVLKENKLFDKSLIVITSDHGVSYDKKGASRRNPFNEDAWKNIISVPLFIKYPFQKKGNTNSSFVTTLDISSTILKIVGVDSPWKSIGQNLKGIENNVQTRSVEMIPGYDKFFKNISTLFQEVRSKKESLFGEMTHIHTIASNYTENPIFDSLLMANIDKLRVESTSSLFAMINDSLNPQEITHFGVIYQGQQFANNKVIAAVAEGKIQAIFESGKANDQDGFFAFSLPEQKIIPTTFNTISLYEIESVSPFVLKKINMTNQQKLLEQEFQSKEPYPYDWKNSVHSYNGLDSLNVDKWGIEVTSSKSNDPFIIFKPILSQAISEPIFHIKIETNRDLPFQLYYQTEHVPKFDQSQAIKYEINKGINSIYIKIPEKDFLGRFRIDLGNKKLRTKVVIHDIELRN